MRAERFDFPNSRGQTLAALLERPDGEAAVFALFAHCFTCGKDNLAAKRIAEALADRGIAGLRFDCPSLGGATVLAAAAQVPEARAVATIAAPSDPSHVVGLFKDDVADIRAQGE